MNDNLESTSVWFCVLFVIAVLGVLKIIWSKRTRRTPPGW